MRYFVYCADRAGSWDQRYELREAHWSYMDGYEAQLYARGPTFNADRTEVTGSLHIVELPSDDAAWAFAEEEPYRRAGVYEAVEVYRFDDLLGRSMWQFPGPDGDRFLAVALTGDEPPAPSGEDRPGGEGGSSDEGGLIVYGVLRDLDGNAAGVGACVQAGDADAAGALVRAVAHIKADVQVTVRPWQFGGRPAS
ncbi:YciI family protein [Dactylosporangium darangshiense]|uniref:YciI family protein n=1 Tax=Dactylosporangium darangshiense TaxID=579108 RepID=A0ABP8D895_9ACTN